MKIIKILLGTSLLALSGIALLTAQEIKKAPSKGGVASPHEEHTWKFGTKTISITYGRPSKKGRVIFGTTEPFNKVWRLGADEATILKTDTDIMIGSLYIPKGSHSLYSIFTDKDQTLIVNKQLGQWGLTYDQAQDLGRVPMKLEKVATPHEQFTIAIDKKSDSGGTFKFMWDDRVASADLMIH
jgi:hypothetical protein